MLKQAWPPAAPSVFRCSNCGAEGEGVVSSMCACGAKVGKRDAGIRCAVNDRRRPELLCEIVAKEVA